MASCNRFFPMLLLLALLTACGSAPVSPPPPAMQARADAAERQARRVWRDGDLQSARSLFEQSLRLHRSLDDLPGIASDAVNLAAVYHRLNQDKQALLLLDGILGDAAIPYPAAMRTIAAFRKAVILVDKGDKDAGHAVDVAARFCAGSCDLAAGIGNLRARLALVGKDYLAAEKYARAAADAAGRDKQELANAYRNAARAEAAQGKYAPALEDYLAALKLDKQLGLPPRIAADLAGTATALDRLGRKEEAAAYARRATAVLSASSGSDGTSPDR